MFQPACGWSNGAEQLSHRGCWVTPTRLRTGANTLPTPRRFTRAMSRESEDVFDCFRIMLHSFFVFDSSISAETCGFHVSLRNHVYIVIYTLSIVNYILWPPFCRVLDATMAIANVWRPTCDFEWPGTLNPEVANLIQWSSLGCNTFWSAISKGRRSEGRRPGQDSERLQDWWLHAFAHGLAVQTLEDSTSFHWFFTLFRWWQGQRLMQRKGSWTPIWAWARWSTSTDSHTQLGCSFSCAF